MTGQDGRDFDADGLDWDDAGEWCEVPCGRTFDDRETALSHIGRCDICPSDLGHETTASA